MAKAKRTVFVAAALFFCISMLPSLSSACKCMPPTIQTGNAFSDSQFFGFVKKETKKGYEYRYEMTVIHVFKGCFQRGQTVYGVTPVSSATCSQRLSIGQMYLIGGTQRAKISGYQAVNFGSCGYNVPWQQLTTENLNYLKTRNVVCGTNHYCASGDEPVNCFVDPCAVNTCEDAAECVSNYCNGCGVDFYDSNGWPVCY